jgi:hypothetical protein
MARPRKAACWRNRRWRGRARRRASSACWRTKSPNRRASKSRWKLYQELSRSRDEWALAEIEQIVTAASQQLQLAGNVQAALLALQTAEGRLARPDRPQFIPLRRVLNRDIERLKAAPNMDIAGMALRLDNLIQSVDSLPLQFDERLQSAPKRAGSGGATGVWERVLSEVWDEMKQLVRIRHMDRPDAALLPPAQAYFLRENLRLRLLDARQRCRARPGTFSRRLADRNGLDDALLRHAREKHHDRAREPEAAFGRQYQRGAAHHRRQPGGGAQFQGVARKGPAVNTAPGS